MHLANLKLTTMALRDNKDDGKGNLGSFFTK